MSENKTRTPEPDAVEVAQEIALKAAADIATQTEFAVIDASHRDSVAEAAKRFDAIRHYAERALTALSRVTGRPGDPTI